MNPLLRSLFLLCCLSLASQVLAKKNWIHIQSEHFEVFSETGKGRTRTIVEELHDTHGIFEVLFPKLGNSKRHRLKVIIAKERTLNREIAPLYKGKPKDLAGFYGKSLEGRLLVINGSVDWNYLREVVLHEYTHFLLDQPGIEFPLWMNEGLAEVFSTISRNGKGKVTVGRANDYRLLLLARSKLMPLDELFAVDHSSPVYNNSGHGAGIYYAQSWALIHYLLFGTHELPKNAFTKVVEHAIAGKTFYDTAIQKLLGRDLDTLKRELDSYCDGGEYSSYRYTLDDADSDLQFEEFKLSGKELEYLIVEAKLSIRGRKEAQASVDAFIEAYPDEPESYSLRGYLELLSGRDPQAIELLEKAVKRSSQSPQTYLHFAGAKLRQYINSTTYRENALDELKTRELLTYLFKARALAGPFDEKLYHCIGEVWLSSQVRPTSDHMAILIEGLQNYPHDSHLAFYLARYYEKEGEFENALQLHQRYYQPHLPPYLKVSYEQLAYRIKTTQEQTK
ncbi:tetratricopeptide repeat protein [Pelagicoccus sp. SDUM812005]|uniref:tetratricopeptide repeat protein n=1 Tax=Pelagicoccus sp. SDUM812005 TaxID=3041257 RepID=UPI00280C677E|nr:tetratricopeptide repeat protein [Pelagicoccus sp. SDUM812005]MDQ8183219.1 DUF1570 domain-containing protein [Pelagicoccus sp. SDUM812005]